GDDTVSGIDGRSDRETEGDDFISNNRGRLEDGPSEDGGISEVEGAERSSDSVDMFVDGSELEEELSAEMKLI
ncbi:hypothetical protein KI387_020601, partial [Taxus chinensis]